MNVAIVGGGNVGTLMAAEIAQKGHCVTVLTSQYEKWEKNIEVYDNCGKLIFISPLIIATNDVQYALKDAEIIFITVPAYLFEETAERILPFLTPAQTVGVVPGGGGAEFAFRQLINNGIKLFGFQRVHCISRLKERGKSVKSLGRKSKMEIASIPAKHAIELKDIMTSLFDMPCQVLDNYLCLTLTPSNPILHTARLYDLFNGYKCGDVYSKNFLFYEDWTDNASEILIEMDSELQDTCKKIPMELEEVKPLTEYYESKTAKAMTNKLSNIEAFKGLLSPMIQIEEDKYIPDFYSRYFIADFDFGLKIINDIANVFNVKAPLINKVWNWYESTSSNVNRKTFSAKFDKTSFLGLYD